MLHLLLLFLKGDVQAASKPNNSSHIFWKTSMIPHKSNHSDFNPNKYDPETVSPSLQQQSKLFCWSKLKQCILLSKLLSCDKIRHKKHRVPSLNKWSDSRKKRKTYRWLTHVGVEKAAQTEFNQQGVSPPRSWWHKAWQGEWICTRCWCTAGRACTVMRTSSEQKARGSNSTLATCVLLCL